MSDKRMTAIIADDESLARRGLAIRLAAHPDVKVVATAVNGREALETVEQFHPDLLFLDIQMPGLSGFDVIKQLDPKTAPAVIFVTAFDQYAVDAFEASAVDYLLKPIEDERLEAALRKVRTTLSQKEAMDQKARLLEVASKLAGEPVDDVSTLERKAETLGERPRLAIRDGGKTTWVYQDEIDWVDAAGDYMCVHANGETHIMRQTMKELEKELEAEQLQRIHRSTIVNVRKVNAMRSHINGEYFLTLECGQTVKLSRSYKDKLAYFKA